jgi:hypothetical protein
VPQPPVDVPMTVFQLVKALLRSNISWTGRQIPRVIWNPVVHYCAHQNLRPVHFLSQMSPIHASFHIHKIHFNVTLLLRLSTKVVFRL